MKDDDNEHPPAASTASESASLLPRGMTKRRSMGSVCVGGCVVGRYPGTLSSGKRLFRERNFLLSPHTQTKLAFCMVGS